MRHLDPATLFHLIFGVLSGCCWTPPVNSETSPETSNTFKCFHYGHCHSSQEGVHGLDCYRKQSKTPHMMQCVWTPGRHSSNKTTYTLVIEQKDRQFCEIFPNISGMSHRFYPFQKFHMTAYVVEARGDDRSCTIAVFTGTPNVLVRCGPPSQITFLRHAGQLVIQVSWVDRNNRFLVHYKELGSLFWKKVDSTEKSKYTVGNLTSSMSYEVQVRCVINSQCHHCIWSDVAIVPPELASTPVIERFDVVPQRMGKRLIIAHWKLANSESAAGYRVTVGKESGEFAQLLNATKPAIRLILSGSAYQINISAFNSAGTSPPAQRTVPAVHSAKDLGLDGDLNVTFNDKGTSNFHISWNPSLSRSYCCYSVEWGLRGEKMSFHTLHQENGNDARIPLKATLQHYKRYMFLLHTRPDKDTCNLKRINDSESTSGRTEAYAAEGTPVRAPGNIFCSDFTSSSLAIAWSDVPEQYARGFLLGYVIYYAESHKGRNFSELPLDAGTNNHTLTNLESQTTYEVQLSAFTAAGEGVRSDSVHCETKRLDYQTIGGAAVGIVGGLVAFSLGAYLCSRLSKRAKKLFWPSIPNPGNSIAIQKLDFDFELEVLEALNREKLSQTEEGDTSSLLIVEGGVAACCPGIQANEEPRAPSDPGMEGERPFPSGRAELAPIAPATGERRGATPGAVSDYTTMELFQQAMSQPPAAPQPLAAGTLARTEQDYIRQA